MKEVEIYNYLNEVYYTTGKKFFHQYCPNKDLPPLVITPDIVINYNNDGLEQVTSGGTRFGTTVTADGIKYFGIRGVIIHIGSLVYSNTAYYGGAKKISKLRIEFIIMHELAHCINIYTKYKRTIPIIDTKEAIDRFTKLLCTPQEEINADWMAYMYLKEKYKNKHDMLTLLELITNDISGAPDVDAQLISYDAARDLMCYGDDHVSKGLRCLVMEDYMVNKEKYTIGPDGLLYTKNNKIKLRPLFNV